MPRRCSAYTEHSHSQLPRVGAQGAPGLRVLPPSECVMPGGPLAEVVLVGEVLSLLHAIIEPLALEDVTPSHLPLLSHPGLNAML